MEKFAHPYVIMLGAVVLLVISGGLLVENRSTVPRDSGVSAWSGGGVVPTNTTVVQNQPSANLEVPGQISYPLPTVHKTTPVAVSTSSVVSDVSANVSDVNTLLALLSRSTSASTTNGNNTSTSSSDIVDPWSFIPTGMISTSSNTSHKSTLQQALYQYGNQAGKFIQDYDGAHTNQAQILTDSINDRTSAVKSAAVAAIGHDLEAIGESLSSLTNVPDIATQDNTALAVSYHDIGAKLVVVSQSGNLRDTDIVAAIKTYDATVDTFNKKYTDLALLFVAQGVTFSSSEPGGVFSFTPSGL